MAVWGGLTNSCEKMRGSFKKFDREQQNLVKQLFFNIKFTKKKQTNIEEK